MSGMFSNAYDFNSSISSWDTSDVSNMSRMFEDAFAFNQDISLWNISSLSDASYMFNNTAIGYEYYDALLQSWSGQNIQSSVVFSAGSSNYTSASVDARNIMTDSYSWTITDGGIIYSVKYNSGPFGSINGDAVQMVLPGNDSSAVTAEPDTGYHFVSWSDGSEINPRNDLNVQSDIDVTAEFSINIYTFTYISGDNGVLTGDLTQSVEFGADGSEITAVPDRGYHFLKWSDGVTDNPRADLNASADITVTAEFELNPSYELNVVNGSGGGSVVEGLTAEITADQPVEGYYFTEWTSEDGGTFEDPSLPETVFTMPGHDVTVTANYKTFTFN
jgi:hypothetical protein